MMVAQVNNRLPIVALSRVDKMFPELGRNGYIRVAQTDVEGLKPNKSRILIRSSARLIPGAIMKAWLAIAEKEGQRVKIRDDLVLESIAANKNRPSHSPHICPQCNITLKNKGRLMMHLENHIIERYTGKKDKDLEDTNIKSAINNGNVKGRQHCCNFCGHVYSNEQELVAHKVTHCVEKYVCPKCPLVFRTTIYLNYHIESVHSFCLRKKRPSHKAQEKSKKPTINAHHGTKRKAEFKKLSGKVKVAKQK